MTREPTKKTRVRGDSGKTKLRGDSSKTKLRGDSSKTKLRGDTTRNRALRSSTGRSGNLKRETERGVGSRSRAAIVAIGRWLRSAAVDDLAIKLVALVLSVTLFVVVNTNRDAVISVSVGVSYTMPGDRVLVSTAVDQVRLTIKGTWRRIKRFDERELDRIDVDLRGVRARDYTFSASEIDLPSGIRLLSIDPPSIPLSFQPLAKKTVPVTVPRLGQPADGYEVAGVVVKPTQIEVRGAKSEIDALLSIDTSEIDLTGVRQTFELSLPLIPPRPAPIIQFDNTPVEVVVTVREKQATRSVESVSVIVVGAEGVEPTALGRKFRIAPTTVDVVLHGPQLTVEGFEGTLEGKVEIHAEDAQGGKRKAKVEVTGAPDGVGVEVVPPTVELSSTPAE